MIYFPPPQPVLNKDIRISGDVEIHPTASLAPGVILQAVPGQRIVIGADVCIGMGVIINASQGSVEIESGAILGSGVLIFGDSKIGKNACIGTTVTIFQANIDARVVIEPGSVLGDDSRQVNLERPQKQKEASNSQQSQTVNNSTFQHKHDRQTVNNKSRVGSDGFYSPNQAQKSKTESKTENIPDNNTFTNPNPPQEATVSYPTQEIKESNKKPVVGQVYINQLLVTLFPHNPDFGSQAKKLS